MKTEKIHLTTSILPLFFNFGILTLTQEKRHFMKITYTLSKNDYLATQEFILDYSKQFKKQLRMQRNLILGIFFITLALLLQLTAKSGWQLTWVTTFLMILALALFFSLFFLKKMTKKMALRKLENNGDMHPELFTLTRKIELGNKQIKTRMGTNPPTTVQWSMVQKVIIKPDFILYFVNDSQANLLYCPSMNLSNTDYEELKQFIYSHLPDERINEIKEKASEK